MTRHQRLRRTLRSPVRRKVAWKRRKRQERQILEAIASGTAVRIDLVTVPERGPRQVFRRSR